VLDLALSDQLLSRPCYILNGYIRIDTVLIEEVDAIGAQALEAGLRDDLDVPARYSPGLTGRSLTQLLMSTIILPLRCYRLLSL
jgi:hypothetical protein